MLIHEFEGVQFKRLIKNAVRSHDEEKAKPQELILVTRESNGYSVWYQYESSSIIAFARSRDVAIRHAAIIDIDNARERARASCCLFDLPESYEAEVSEEGTPQ